MKDQERKERDQAIAKIKTAARELAPDFKDVIQNIEHGTFSGTTQNNYGGYMTLLSTAGKDRVSLLITYLAARHAGANVQGLDSAMRIVDERLLGFARSIA